MNKKNKNHNARKRAAHTNLYSYTIFASTLNPFYFSPYYYRFFSYPPNFSEGVNIFKRGGGAF